MERYAEVNVSETSFLFIRAEPNFDAIEIDRLKNQELVIILLEDTKTLSRNGISGKYVFIEYKKAGHTLRGWAFDSYLKRKNMGGTEDSLSVLGYAFAIGGLIMVLAIIFWNIQSINNFVRQSYNKISRGYSMIPEKLIGSLSGIIKIIAFAIFITIGFIFAGVTAYKNRFAFYVFTLSQNETLAMRYLITLEKIMRNGSPNEDSDYYIRMINVTDVTDIDLAKAILSSQNLFQHFRVVKQIENNLQEDDMFTAVFKLFANPMNFLDKYSEYYSKSNELKELESEFISNNQIITSKYSNITKILSRLSEYEIDFLYENKRLPIYIVDERK